ncbi:hypothetical protein Tco_0934316 [Tanacetum coccineum]
MINVHDIESKVARNFNRGAFELKPLGDFKEHKDEEQVRRPPLQPPKKPLGDKPRRKVTIFETVKPGLADVLPFS